MALRKPNGSSTPVAVGESLRRLCSKVAVELMSIFEPIQVGVQTKAGCEAVIHTTRQWTKSFCDDPGRVLVWLQSSGRQLPHTQSERSPTGRPSRALSLLSRRPPLRRRSNTDFGFSVPWGLGLQSFLFRRRDHPPARPKQSNCSSILSNASSSRLGLKSLAAKLRWSLLALPCKTAFGSKGWCEGLLDRRVTKAR